MRIAMGKRSRQMAPAEFAAWLESHAGIAIDLGTGDGRFVRNLAAREPRRGALGVDLCAANLARASRAAPGNALFVVADALALPDEFRRSASRITVNFPWGSLLRGLLLDAAWLAAVARAGTGLEIRLNAGALAEAGWTLERGAERVSATLRAAGFDVGDPAMLALDDLRQWPTTWAKRLAFGRNPRAVLIESKSIGASGTPGARSILVNTVDSRQRRSDLTLDLPAIEKSLLP
jgi:16S rRNA (adenine(1408)-N(1))-methyltransferase